MIRHAATLRARVVAARKLLLLQRPAQPQRAFHASAATLTDALDRTDTFLRRHGTFSVFALVDLIFIRVLQS